MPRSHVFSLLNPLHLHLHHHRRLNHRKALLWTIFNKQCQLLPVKWIISLPIFKITWATRYQVCFIKPWPILQLRQAQPPPLRPRQQRTISMEHRRRLILEHQVQPVLLLTHSMRRIISFIRRRQPRQLVILLFHAWPPINRATSTNVEDRLVNWKMNKISKIWIFEIWKRFSLRISSILKDVWKRVNWLKKSDDSIEIDRMKREKVNRVKTHWRRFHWFFLFRLAKELDSATASDSELCKVCMDAIADCVFLDCGHIVKWWISLSNIGSTFSSLGHLCQMRQITRWMSDLPFEYCSCCSRLQVLIIEWRRSFPMRLTFSLLFLCPSLPIIVHLGIVFFCVIFCTLIKEWKTHVLSSDFCSHHSSRHGSWIIGLSTSLMSRKGRGKEGKEKKETTKNQDRRQFSLSLFRDERRNTGWNQSRLDTTHV